ncbi:polyprenyl synthetase family protein [Flavobacterium sp.]|uniref:polyprenyl synthetase family protein n=1 Tax=Flavobacterium sp. TaxID=239 RepID=UPI00262635FC|nr:polyprenyl synthetase family protein [Flavobacterium sp.]
MPYFSGKRYMLSEYKISFEEALLNQFAAREPRGLYEPIDYILQDGGKRLRPILVLMGSQFYSGDYKRALSAAKAVEIFHNFTLLHDDIMDAAPLRRGRQTVHEKWDTNTAILSGDAMLILAYQQLEEYEPSLQVSLFRLFSKTALEVCEGQQWDVEFELRSDVTIPEYLQMITYKTAVLVACAFKMGALIGGASAEQAQLLYDFGLNLGIAFQIQDDYLDAFGNPETFGKQVGGDIIENKKTYLYLLAKQSDNQTLVDELEQWFSGQPQDPTEKIARVKHIFQETNAAAQTQKAIEKYTDDALKTIKQLAVSEDNQKVLRAFALNLMQRDS